MAQASELCSSMHTCLTFVLTQGKDGPYSCTSQCLVTSPAPVNETND